MRPLILVTTDDGVDALGFRAVIDAALPLGDVLAAATRTNQTGMGRSVPKGPDVGKYEMKELVLPSGERLDAYSIIGTPALVVAHAILEFAPRKPDLCISGINMGENVGSILTTSGTFGAALEAESYGVPSIAISQTVRRDSMGARLEGPEDIDWSAAQYFTTLFANNVLELGLPDGARILNINIPVAATLETPIRRTMQSRHAYYWFRKPIRDDGGEVRFPVEVEYDLALLEPDSDIQAVIVDGVVSATLCSPSLSSPLEWRLPQ